MSVTYDRPRKVARRAWLLSWSSDLGGTPAFYVYVNSVGPLVTYETSRVFYVTEGESLHVDVYDDSAQRPPKRWPGRFLLQWWMVDDSDHYRIEEYVSGEWVLRVFYREQKVLGVVNPALDPVPVAITPRTALFGVMVLLLRSPGWDVR